MICTRHSRAIEEEDADRRSQAEDRRRQKFEARIIDAELGVLADVTRVRANHQISISSLIQHEALEDQEDNDVPLVTFQPLTSIG